MPPSAARRSRGLAPCGRTPGRSPATVMTRRCCCWRRRWTACSTSAATMADDAVSAEEVVATSKWIFTRTDGERRDLLLYLVGYRPALMNQMRLEWEADDDG